MRAPLFTRIDTRRAILAPHCAWCVPLPAWFQRLCRMMRVYWTGGICRSCVAALARQGEYVAPLVKGGGLVPT